MKIGKEIPKKDFIKWLDALRSGEYEQIIGRLNKVEGFCCLGVACKELVPEKDLEMYDGYIYGVIPLDQHKAPKWIQRIDRDVCKKLGSSLSALNDEHNLTFIEIADVLEELYLNQILDWE